jgi:hypothetical protein
VADTIVKKRKTTPPISAAAYEDRLILLAMQQAEYQLVNMTASSQLVSHYLMLASKQEEVKLKKLELETELLAAKIVSEESNQNIEQMFDELKLALRSYGVR